MQDVLVEEIRRIREDLIRRYGGIHGYVKFCQAQERAAARAKSRRRKQASRRTAS